jgi:hypothetical protein
MHTMLYQGCVLALTGRSAEAIQSFNSSVIGYNSLDADVVVIFGQGVCENRSPYDAWRCIRDAFAAVETTKERWFEAELNRVAGEIALKSPEPDAAKAESCFERAYRRPPTTSQILGTPRLHEPRASLA